MDARLIVEVQDTQTLLWHNAHIVDKRDGMFLVKYVDPKS